MSTTNLPPADTRVFLFHSADAAGDPGSATDRLNEWLGKDRSNAPYPKMRVREISTSSDGQGGVFFTVVCTLGTVPEVSDPVTSASRFDPAASSSPEL